MSWEGAHILNPSLSKRRGASDLRKDMGCVWLLVRIMGKKQKIQKHRGPRRVHTKDKGLGVGLSLSLNSGKAAKTHTHSSAIISQARPSPQTARIAPSAAQSMPAHQRGTLR